MTTAWRVTVVIPAHNAGRFIDDALASVASQRLPAHEVVVVNDGSTDDTTARVRAWGDSCGAAKLISLESRSAGPSASRNRGIMAGSGDLFAFLDGDDCFLPWHLERLVPAFDHEPGAAVAFGDLMKFDEREAELGGNLEAIRERLHQISTPIPGTGLLRLSTEARRVNLERTVILPSSLVVSREAVVRGGLFDPTLAYGEDVDFIWRMLGVGCGVWCDAPTSRRRLHAQNASDPSRADWGEPQILRALGKLWSATPNLTPAEAASLDRRLSASLWVTGWLASGGGLGRYRQWRRDANRWTGRRAPFRLKQLLRALVASLRKGG